AELPHRFDFPPAVPDGEYSKGPAAEGWPDGRHEPPRPPCCTAWQEVKLKIFSAQPAALCGRFLLGYLGLICGINEHRDRHADEHARRDDSRPGPVSGAADGLPLPVACLRGDRWDHRGTGVLVDADRDRCERAAE